MPEDRYVLTAEERDALAWLVADYRRRFGLGPHGRKGEEPPEDPTAPEVYVAFTPSGGIPARSGTTPGSVLCDVHKVYGGVLTDAGFERLVFNLNADAVDGSAYVKISRDKFGVWWADSAEGEPGTGTGTDTFARGFILRATLDTTLTQGGSAYATIRTPGWNLTGTSDSIEVWDDLLTSGATMDAGRKVHVFYEPETSKWWVTSADCES